MANVVNIRIAIFDEAAGDIVVIGHCSFCSNKLVQQPPYGFPTVCPFCRSELENGYDARNWIEKIYLPIQEQNLTVGAEQRSQRLSPKERS